MEELFDTVLKNPFLLIIIIGGVISFLKGKSKKPEQENKQPSSNPKPVETPTPFGRNQQTEQRRPVRTPVEETVKTLTVEEHRKEQMVRLSQQMAANEHKSMKDRPKVADATRERQINKLASKYNQEQFKKEFKKSLTPKGLIDSIVMAEVLGAPRSRQQYQSPVLKRRNTK